MSEHECGLCTIQYLAKHGVDVLPGINSLTSLEDVLQLFQLSFKSKNSLSGQSNFPDWRSIAMLVNGSWRIRKCNINPGDE